MMFVVFVYYWCTCIGCLLCLCIIGVPVYDVCCVCVLLVYLYMMFVVFVYFRGTDDETMLLQLLDLQDKGSEERKWSFQPRQPTSGR